MKNNSLSRSQHKENFLNPIWKQNPLFVASWNLPCVGGYNHH